MLKADPQSIINQMFEAMVAKKASDIYVTLGVAPMLRLDNKLQPMDMPPMEVDDLEHIANTLMTENQREEFHSTFEMNFAVAWESKARFRINVYKQQQSTGIVIRRIQTDIPTIEGLKLPEVYGKLAMLKKGLIFLVGGTGSGKSSSLAAMINQRNTYSSGHIITIEDPIEFVHQHKGCVVTQREIGIDTFSFGMALKNALRQRCDVVVIGEIRDRETLEHALYFAETGHLCISTLHASNTNQAIERIINFFPEEYHRQVMITVSQNLKAIISQKIIPSRDGRTALATEILLNQGLITRLIEEGNVQEIKETMEQNALDGVQTFDQALYDLYISGLVSREMALEEADNPANLRLRFKQAEAAANRDSDPKFKLERDNKNQF
ncbi:MAG: PilT/PilU family type 4a pilus ATPase [Alphaproteobacteria bacterium]|nr:PilT/PilU family type 4a pilus ATPase [Alphaproteobacteria bacterium]